MTVGLGIIGAGIMGERLLRAAREHASDLVHITGVWDPAKAACDRIASTLPGTAVADSAEAVIEGAELVYVASPPATHLGHAGAALARGRAVLCEKPLAVDVAEATRFVAEHPSARAAVNFPFASSGAVDRLATWLREGAIGAPQSLDIEVAFATWPRAWQHDAAAWLNGPREGGFTREVVSHFLFLARRLLGVLVLTEAQADFGSDGGSERALRASLTVGGIRATVRGEVGSTAAEEQNSWVLRGTGAIRLRDWGFAERERPDGTWAPDPDAVPHADARPLTLRRQLEGAVRMTRGETHHLATLTEALEVQFVVEKMLAH